MSDVEKNSGTHKPEFEGEAGKLTPVSHRFSSVQWSDVLTIRNGKNQKAVECSEGEYPICGSGGEMGRASAFITKGDSVIIGRKGNISSPILMREPFWNVDTAFGLEPNEERLTVEYLYYFCEWFNFEKLNKAVTIPSLTKADLLKIDMPLPPINLQREFTDRVVLIDNLKVLLENVKQTLDDLVKSQFVEMFGDPNKTQCTTTLEDAFFIRDDLRKPLSGKERESMKEGALYPYYGANGVVDWINQYLIDTDALCFAEDCGSYGPDEPTAYIIREKAWVNNHAHLLLPRVPYFLEYACSCFRLLDVSRFISGTTRSKMTQAQLKQIKIGIPESARLKEFADFVAQVDKLGFDCCREIVCCGVLFSSMSASLLCT